MLFSIIIKINQEENEIGLSISKINKAYTFSDNYLVDDVHDRTTRERKGETLFPEFSMFVRIR